MVRILRAFAWMRWRVLLNSFERTGSKDALERLSLAADQLGPILATLVLVPSLLAMSALSGFAGYVLATGPPRPIAFEVLRYLTLAVSALAIIGPILLPIMERTNPVRLLLLPIPRATLYVAQASGALADPWTLVVLPVALFLPLGLAIGGAVQAAALSLAAGLIFLVVLVGLSTLTACAVQLVVRDRRRGELIALAFILIVPLAGMLSNLFVPHGSRRDRRQAPVAPIERSAARTAAARIGEQAFALTPSEQYVAATRAGSEGRGAASAAALLTLTATAILLHGLAALALQRILAFPGSMARRRTAGKSTAAGRRLPGLSSPASAVAMAQIRLALRTPRGRSLLLSPVLLFIVLGVVTLRSGAGALQFFPQSGLGLAALAGFISIATILPFATNQFAIDGAGLTLELLSPLSDDDLLTGKAVAIGLMAAVPASVCGLFAFLLSPAGSRGLWLSLPVAAASIYLLFSPVAAVASTLFPRVVDLNSVGRSSNAHGLAGLMGIGSVLAAALPPAGLAVLANAWLERPGLAPVLMLAWCIVALGLNRLLFRAVRTLLGKRRENLAMVAG